MSSHDDNGDSHDGRKETSLERLDRNLEELTGELRVVVTGVQVLFAFLLVVPFNSGFRGIGPFERGVYLATLLCAALAAVCMMAPPAQHRILFRQEDKRHLVFASNRVTIAGIVLLVFAMCGSILLVGTKMFGAPTGAIATAVIGAAFVTLWLILPLRRRARLRRGATPSSPANSGGRVQRGALPGGRR